MKENTKPTQEEHKEYLAAHYGQKVAWDISLPVKGFAYDTVDANLLSNVNESDCLVLTTLSDITDEDAKYCQLLQGYNNCDIVIIEPHFDLEGEFMVCFESSNHDNYDVVNINTIDYLRSKGYALPWMGYSVEQLISFGWLKLRQKGGEQDA